MVDSARNKNVIQSVNLIDVNSDSLEVGMFIHRFGDSLLSHPFWRTAFLIKNEEEIAKLVNAGIKTVFVDKVQSTNSRTRGTRPQSAIDLDKYQRDMESDQHRSTSETKTVLNLTCNSAGYEQMRLEIEKTLHAVAGMFESARLNETQCVDSAHTLASDIYRNVCDYPTEILNLARLKTKNNYTYMHSVAVSALMILLAKTMGLEETEVKDAGLAGLLHDIGKSFVSDMLLKKQGPLTPDEFLNIKRHPEFGAAMLKKNGSFTRNVIDACYHHHEKYNGEGYPQGLRADETPLLARMVSICDVYDAVTSERPYKRGWDPAYAIHQMSTWRGHFDPFIFQSFVKALGVYPNGSLVRMRSNRLAVVCKQNPESLLKPSVNVFFDIEKDCQLKIQLVDLAASDATDEITAREPRENWGFITKLLESMSQASPFTKLPYLLE
jgi:putative nucleotidyltransferase with HDIG domain